MRFYKIINDQYIKAVGTGHGWTEISEEEYESIITAIHNKPQETAEIRYRLKTDLTWESYEVEPTPPMPEPEPDAEEILDILLGGDAE